MHPVTQLRSRRTYLGVLGLGVLAALALLIGADRAAAGGATYDYKVNTFDYLVTGNMAAERAPPEPCISGLSAFWGGGVTATSSEFQNLQLGDGSLEIHRTGTSGKVDATADVDYEFADAAHSIWTQCPTPTLDGITSETGPCSDSATEKLSLGGVVVGGVGDKVNIIWDFRQNDVAGRWVPETFTCVEPLIFAHQDCRSKKVPLRTFTKKKFKLYFLCTATSTTPPAGQNWDTYTSFVSAFGYLGMKRTGQSH